MERFKTTPSTLSAVIVEHRHGAITGGDFRHDRISATRQPLSFGNSGFWDPADEDEANLIGLRLFDCLRPFDAGEVYVNSLDEGEGHPHA